MIRKYLKRIITWTILTLILGVVTYFSRQAVINPIHEEIAAKERKNRDLQQQIQFIERQINNYQNTFFDYYEMKKLIPDGGINELDERLEILDNYVKKPVAVAKGTLNSQNITFRQKPAQLKLSNNVEGVKVTATVEFKTFQQVEAYLAELHNTMRLVYIDKVNFNLPTENTNMEEFVHLVTIEYYLFYYPVK